MTVIIIPEVGRERKSSLESSPKLDCIDLSLEFTFTDWTDDISSIRIKDAWERSKGKFADTFGEMSEVTRRVKDFDVTY